jgi:hypothetical protein
MKTNKTLLGFWILGALAGGAAACASSPTSNAGNDGDAGSGADSPSGDASHGDASPNDAQSGDASHGDSGGKDAGHDTGSDGGGVDASDGGQDASDGNSDGGSDAAVCVAGQVMVCGWDGANGTMCALSNGATSFGPSSIWQPGFNGASAGEVATIQMPDLDGDGQADFCAWDAKGIECALSNGTSFGQLTTWQSDFGPAFNDASSDYLSIRYPDVDGDGKADVCGRNANGILCALSTGTGFGASSTWQSDLTDAGGWNGSNYEFSIQYADINGDGKADVCGRGQFGIDCAVSNGSAFGPLGIWQGDFSDMAGWGADPSYWQTIRFPDINGDGMADVCGRGQFGIDCAVSNGSAFGAIGIWQGDFGDAGGWNGATYYPSIQFPDVDGDGKADVCGRGVFGVDCAVSNGTAFGSLGVWQSGFSDASGWGSSASYFSTIQFPDVNGDGKADVCGRDSSEIACALSSGSAFGPQAVWEADFSDANGWNAAPLYQSIQFPLAVKGNCNPGVLPTPLLSPYRRYAF